MGKYQTSRPVLIGVLLGVMVTPVFFVLATITTYHLDMGVAQLIFPYSVIADPYIGFTGIAFFLAAVQWPVYGFFLSLARTRRREPIGRLVIALAVVLLIAHCWSVRLAYDRHKAIQRVTPSEVLRSSNLTKACSGRGDSILFMKLPATLLCLSSRRAAEAKRWASHPWIVNDET